jgi:nucleotide-binding universal stress UspA family protein
VTEFSDHFHRILVPVDFLPASDEAIQSGQATKVGNHELEFAPASIRAVRLAAALARSGGGKLTMLHATPAMQSSVVYTGPVTVPAQILTEIHARAKETSLAALAVLTERHCQGIEVERVARPGTSVHIVLEEAKRVDADLIVMAASGRSRVARFFVGSTADRIIREAGCPVLVIPADSSEA